MGEKADALKVDGVRAKLRVKERDDLLSHCMIGRIVEVLEVLWIRER